MAKVIKGGRRFAFRTVVIVGDNKGRVGIGIGKARGVPDSIRKGADRARRNMSKVSLSGSTIPHPVVAEYGGAVVLLRPASPGTGVIAGGGVRAVLEAVGIHDMLSKSQGSNNVLNVTMATLSALEQLRTAAGNGSHARQRCRRPAALLGTQASGVSEYADKNVQARTLKVTLVKSPIGFEQSRTRSQCVRSA